MINTQDQTIPYRSTMTAKLLPLSILPAAIVLATGFVLHQMRVEAAIILVLGGLWLAGQWRGWRWIASPMLVCLAGAAALGIWLGVAAGWMVGGLVLTLSAWDLDHFAWRLRYAHCTGAIRSLEWGHLRRLLLVDAIGLLLATVALTIRLQLGFGLAFLLGIVAIIGLGRVITALRRILNGYSR